MVSWGGYVASGVGSGAASLAKGTTGAWGALAKTLGKEGWRGLGKVPGSASQGYVSAVWGDGQSADRPSADTPDRPGPSAASAPPTTSGAAAPASAATAASASASATAAGAQRAPSPSAGSLILELRYETAAASDGDAGVGWAILTAENASHALQARSAAAVSPRRSGLISSLLSCAGSKSVRDLVGFRSTEVFPVFSPGAGFSRRRCTRS